MRFHAQDDINLTRRKSIASRLCLPLPGPDTLNSHLLPKALDLILSNEGDHRVRSNAEVVRWKTSPQAGDTAHLDLLHGTVDGSLEGHLASHRVRLRLLNLGLDEVKRQAEEGREKAGDGAGAEHLKWAGRSGGYQYLLRLRISGQHA